MYKLYLVGTTVGDRTLFRVSCVCFCDIPLPDLNIHITKYKGFGIGFKRQFLVEKGANPTFYVTNDSIIEEQRPSMRSPDWFDLAPINITREVYLDSLVKMLALCCDKFTSILYSSRAGSALPGEQLSERFDHLIVTLVHLRRQLDKHVFSFIVPFHSAKDDTDPDNFYMEREWRTLGQLRFGLQDVTRIVIPENYSRRLRHDVPEFYGQLSFSESPIVSKNS